MGFNIRGRFKERKYSYQKNRKKIDLTINTAIFYQMCRKAPAFRHGDIRHVHRICASN